MANTQYSISAASRIIGKSRATIARHMAAGKLSYELDGDGNKVVDGSELVRVYGDTCDFSREERRGQTPPSSRPETKATDSSAAMEAMQEKLIQQYVSQIEHLQQALDKAQEGQNRVTLLLEQRSTEKTDWQKSLDAMAQTIANQTDRQIKELKDNHDKEINQLKRLLHRERTKSVWQKLFSSGR